MVIDAGELQIVISVVFVAIGLFSSMLKGERVSESIGFAVVDEVNLIYFICFPVDNMLGAYVVINEMLEVVVLQN